MTIKQRSAKILAASLLLMTFLLGQLIVIAHSHKQAYASHQNQSKKDNSDDKCKTCAQNSHAQLFFQQQQDLFSLAVTNVNCYQYLQDSYYGVNTHQSCNRGPPVS
ncbi:hypothetical protein [Mucilaginibacter polytrichastri]|uniref:Uncharacterized protein n=1 Tax=Mucilaginibacter polytrichastri TaxID=1302689 RepID=A0A1Q5ZT04_9SPHI|nr:hypothetical protein [Mucilaginibacter polytrichastri]OKS84877.1 hypothetical protein RG47T_0314 [Mucilaginibacter polytrichastri]SFS48345.1 hypothetical protein SAMN04487890_101762 [Mucilaginibacter polytrichastri]